jgi:hypothetical protein
MKERRLKRRPALTLGSVLLAIGSGTVAAPVSVASAAGTNAFSVSVVITHGSTPAPHVLAPSTTYTFAFTLTNAATSPEEFGSAQILVPAGFTASSPAIASHPDFAVHVAGDSLLLTSHEVNESGVQPGDAIVVTARVTTPPAPRCAAAWPTRVKESEDFGGTVGEYARSGSNPKTTVGPSHLVFATQPSTTEYAADMLPVPAVIAVDPCGKTVTGFTSTVTLTDAAGHLSAGGATAATGTVAHFAHLRFDDYGFDDSFRATAGGYTPARSHAFSVVQRLVRCSASQPCASGTVSDSHATTRVAISAAAGARDIITVTVKGKPTGACSQPAGSAHKTPLGTTVTFNVAKRGKTVTMTLPRALVLAIPDNGKPFMDICIALPTGQTLIDKFGHRVSQGLLPDCVSASATTCITLRQKHAGDELITFRLPAGDPHASWY